MSIAEFHVRPAKELTHFTKKIDHLLYSHSAEWRRYRHARQTNRSNLIDEHPYSLRVEAYGLDGDHTPTLVGLWLYPIYFDFLPSFRLVKVLRIRTINPSSNPCSSNPCQPWQICQPVLNRPSGNLCLCPNSSTGENCSETHSLCLKGYCRKNSLCKPNYRGLVAGNELPY